MIDVQMGAEHVIDRVETQPAAEFVSQRCLGKSIGRG